MAHNFANNPYAQTEKRFDVPLCAKFKRSRRVLCNWCEIRKLGEKIVEIGQYRNAIALMW
jgi:hypothetical protein